jgi:hypothetical protein
MKSVPGSPKFGAAVTLEIRELIYSEIKFNLSRYVMVAQTINEQKCEASSPALVTVIHQ